MAASSIRFFSAGDEGSTPDLELSGTLYLPSDSALRPLPGLVVGHGAGSRASHHEDFCRAACSRGFAVLAVDFRGHGDSQGLADGPLEQDILAAVRLLREHPDVDPGLVCYRGSSMGGFYGLKAAPTAGFAALALLCPATEATMLTAIDRAHPEGETLVEVNSATEALPRWDTPRLRNYFEGQDVCALAAQVRCPVLLVHARGDEVVPFANSLMLTQHLPSETTLLALQGGSHTSAQHDPAIHTYTVAWLWDKVMRARDARAC